MKTCELCKRESDDLRPYKNGEVMTWVCSVCYPGLRTTLLELQVEHLTRRVAALEAKSSPRTGDIP